MKPSGEKNDLLEAIVFLQTRGLLPDTMRQLRTAWLNGEKPLLPPDVRALMQSARYDVWEHNQLCVQALHADNQRAWGLVRSLLAENAVFRRALGLAQDDLGRHVRPQQRCEGDAEHSNCLPSASPMAPTPCAHGELEDRELKRRRDACDDHA